MTTTFFDDEAARQLQDIAPYDGCDEGSSVQRLSEKDQTAQRMINAREVFFQVPADLGRRFQARQHVDEAKQRNAQRLVFERPVDHPAQQILGLEKGRLMLRRVPVKRPRQGLHGLFGRISGRSHHRKPSNQTRLNSPPSS